MVENGAVFALFAAILTAYLMVDVMERLDWFARYRATGDEVARFYAARIPLLVALTHGDALGRLCSKLPGPGPAGRSNGRNLLSLVREKGRGWREWIDLEHNICYSPANHWNALTDAHWKYVFHARDGEEQLFHLDEDPHELRDLAGEPRHESALREWRSRMVGHLSGRGEEFVRNGRLALRIGSVWAESHQPAASRPRHLIGHGREVICVGQTDERGGVVVPRAS